MTNQKEKRKVPELRFPEFSGEWEEKKLNEISDRVTRKNKNLISTMPLTISAKYGLVDQISYFNKSVSGSNLENYYLIKNGEFAYNKSYSKGYPFGAIKRLNNYKQGILSTLYICFKPNKFIDTDFLEKYFDSTKWHREVSAIAVEGARNHGLLNIPVNEFFNVRLHLPNTLQEQQKIGEFFSKLDRQIELEEKKLVLLEEQKKGYMQKIFSQELRFKDENGEEYPEWENKKLKEYTMYQNGYAFKSNDFMNKGIPVIRIQDIQDGFIKNGSTYINKSENELENYLINKNDIIIAMSGATTGKIGMYISDENSFLNQRLCIIRTNELMDSKFLYHLLKSKKFLILLKESLVAGAQPNISSKDIENMQFYIPKINEQKKIGEFLSLQDIRISKIKNKIEYLISNKNYLLNKLFI